MTYTAPLADMRFALREVAGLERIGALPGYEHAPDDTVDAVLEEAAKLAGNGLAPLNRDGDKVGAKLENGVVRTAPGFTAIYKEFVAGGWDSPPFGPEVGGQGTPWRLAATVDVVWQGARAPRQPACAASRCSSSQSSCPGPAASRASATISAACRSSTSSASMPVRPA